MSEAIRFLARKSQADCDLHRLYAALRLGSPGKIASRQEELKQICLLLKDCAVETGLPILIAAQFNRTVQSPPEMIAQAIGEAGDIERISALILGFGTGNSAQEKTEDGSLCESIERTQYSRGSRRSI